jgi:tetratricopeptide (TPR) repeat protein
MGSGNRHLGGECKPISARAQLEEIMTEPTEDRERAALDWMSKGIAFLEAAHGPGSGKLKFMVRDQVAPQLHWSAGEQRQAALQCFLQASELIPNEPWIWFQIGWSLLADDREISDQQAARCIARSALEKVVALRPHNCIGHLALAWSLYRDVKKEEQADPEWNQTIWQGEVGEHLRQALDWKRAAAASRAWTSQLAGDPVMADWLPTQADDAAMVRALEAMDALIPDDYRCAYCRQYSLHVEGLALERRWLEEALRWPTHDNVEVLGIYYRLGLLVRREGIPLKKAHEYFMGAAHCLLGLTVEERGSLSWRYPGELVALEWLLEFPGPSRVATANELPLYLDLLETAFEIGRSWSYEDDDSVFQSIGSKAAIAGHVLLESNDLPRARHYLELARGFEDRLVAGGWYDPEEDDEFLNRGPDYWRVVAARALRDISIVEGDFCTAREENQRVLELLPRDRDGLHWSVELEQLIRSDSYHLDELAQLLTLHEMTNSVLAQVVLQQGALEQLADLRRDVGEIAQARTLDVSDMNALVDQLHDIAQHQTRISPASLQRARQRMVAELGEVTFGALLPESQHFLTTAEVLYSASEDLAEHIDSGPIVVEYAKAVEAELRNRVLRPLAELLERMNFQGELFVGRNPIEYRNRSTWRTRLPPLTLGAVAGLLKRAMGGPENQIIKNILEGLEPTGGWALQFANDVDMLANRYRNGAAHSDAAMGRTALKELRDLLFGAGLLGRIIELDRRIQRI